MHELALTQDIVEAVSEKIESLERATKVSKLMLEIGKLSGVLPDAIRFCFDLCSEGTPLEKAELVITEPEGRAQCRVCNMEFAVAVPYGQCQCGSMSLEWISGNELKIIQMEVI